ncbi:DUF4364 family protein [Anaerotalea alkaliphila]|uniref:DUF4364 family protein n=1 Tax=Anaerotalea alkaliphila TaxID=2662126 RepID=A0A7X5HTP8_9FIRM|nr:DUF4364 family protein [Anaerotalea alkaliphila]NDL66492.1 DUF4364 family protein [Anaerotalea alkaliphila]
MHAGSYEISLNKLMILYMIKNVDMPLSGSQISEYILEKGYTNYFSLQEYIGQMLENDMIRTVSLEHFTLYEIAPEGLETLEYFENRIPESTKEEILDFLKKNKYKIRSESELHAEYVPQSDGSFLVHCVAKENKKVLIDVSVEVVEKDQAVRICNLWEKNSHLVYKLLLETLLMG